MASPLETDVWPFVKAKWFLHPSSPRTVRVICIHSTESLESKGSAAGVAHYFQTTERPASAHVIVDDQIILQAVADGDIAAAAPGANQDGIHIEICGKAAQTEQDWQDTYSRAAVENAANVAAQYSLKFDIPVVHLTNEQLANGDRGIVGHYQVSEVYKKSNHSDPGDGFAWGQFIAAVKDHREKRAGKTF